MLARWLATAILAATLAFAQRGGGGGMEGGMGGGGGGARGGGPGGEGGVGVGGGMPRVQRQSRLDTIADKLKLNKEQKQQVQTIFQAAMEEARPVAEQIAKAREAIGGAMIDGKSDDAGKMLTQYAILAGQMTSIETKAFGKVYALLKPNQQSKAPAAFELMAGMFGGHGPGGGRGRGRDGDRN
jgi:Spy/CpxP family protein refolding chaperone